MSERGEAKAKRDAHASGAKPRPEGRGRERGWRPTGEELGVARARSEAARPRAIEGGRQLGAPGPAIGAEAAT